MMGGSNRERSWRKALRKRRIDSAICWGGHLMYDNLHQYSKNKIHCSCPMCSPKTNNKGKRRLKHGNYYPSKYWKHSDLVRFLAAEEEMREWGLL